MWGRLQRTFWGVLLKEIQGKHVLRPVLVFVPSLDDDRDILAFEIRDSLVRCRNGKPLNFVEIVAVG